MAAAVTSSSAVAAVVAVALLLLLPRGGRGAEGLIDCSTVLTLVSSCTEYITYGVPSPAAGTACCNAVASLHTIANSADNRRSACSCLMAIITTYNPNATAVGRLPGLCGISLGFTVDPNTDCATSVDITIPPLSLSLSIFEGSEVLCFTRVAAFLDLGSEEDGGSNKEGDYQGPLYRSAKPIKLPLFFQFYEASRYHRRSSSGPSTVVRRWTPTSRSAGGAAAAAAAAAEGRRYRLKRRSLSSTCIDEPVVAAWA